MTRIVKLAGTSGLALIVSLLLPASSATYAQTNTQTPTFAKDVLPLLQRSCQKCHRPDTAARCALDLPDVRPWARRSSCGWRHGRCRPGTSTAASASTSTIRR